MAEVTASYKIGQATVAAGGVVITGIGTAWLAWIRPGDTFEGADGRSIEVASVTDDTHIVPLWPWPGAAQVAGNYRIRYAPFSARATEKAREAVEALKIPQTGMPMVWDGTSVVDGNPGGGRVRGNHATNPTVLYVSKTDARGGDISGRLATWAKNTVLGFRPTDGANAFLDFDVSGAMVDAGTYVKVPVVLRAGTVPADRAALAMAGVPSGKDGANGIFTAIATKAKVEAGTDNVDGVTSLGVRQATAARGHNPYVNLHQDGGRFGSGGSTVIGAFYFPTNYLSVYNATMASVGKFISNNTTHGGNAGNLDPAVDALITKIRNPSQRLYNVEFWVAQITAGAPNVVIINIGGTNFYLSLSSSNGILVPLRSTYHCYLRALDAPIGVLAPTVVIEGGAPSTAGAVITPAMGWTSVACYTSVDPKNFFGYQPNPIWIGNTAEGQRYQIACPALIGGIVDVDPNVGVIPAYNSWPA